jgi:Lrp/AsnC family transcriptional regulator, regulator for asnA, asnC and gidA
MSNVNGDSSKNPSPARLSLDDIDRTLINELQRDGRASYADLADLVGLSPAATRLRVQRLLDAGVVQVVGVTDPLALGYPVMAALGVRVERNVRAVADRIAAIQGVIYVVFTSGGFDLLVEVLCEDSSRLLHVIDDEVRAIEGVRSVESFTYFGIHTHRFVWGAR